MINWFDMPAEGLSNGGLFEVKELEVTENGTYETKGEMYNKVTVNVEGGGGSSDFSTAQVTLNLTVEGATLIETSLETVIFEYPTEDFSYLCTHLPSINNKCSVVLYRGHATAEGVLATGDGDTYYTNIIGTPVTTGGVNWDSELGNFNITGDGTITAELEL